MKGDLRKKNGKSPAEFTVLLPKPSIENATRLVQGADSMLYPAKKSPGPRLDIGDTIECPPVISK